MANKDPMTILQQCCDMLADDLEGQPLDIPRPSKEDMVLVSTATYSRLVSKVAELEAELMTEEELQAKQEEVTTVLIALSKASRLN
ncbi:hypothetical protein [Sulfitobacter sp.]|uniref:hypothetical protein n=1 Tax=Sulfitobacter sp. TaxID=1903071 RepID=UPI00272DB74D|nr:hypothetical protein [Sulfitobacter sp.]